MTEYLFARKDEVEAHTITAGAGLSGGGALSTNPTIALDIDGQSAIAMVGADEIIFYDASGAVFGKRTITDFISDFSLIATGDSPTFADVIADNVTVNTLLDTADIHVGDASNGLFWDVTTDRLALGFEEFAMTIATASIGTKLAIHPEAGEAALEVHQHSTGAGILNGAVLYGARSDGSEGAESIVVDNDYLMTIAAVGYDGTDYAQGARIDFLVDGTPGAGDMPTRIEFSTSADGSEAPTLALTIDSTQIATFVNSPVVGANPVLDDGDIGSTVQAYALTLDHLAANFDYDTSSYAGDMDALVTFGIYRCQGATNAPTGNPGMVLITGFGTSQIFQLWFNLGATADGEMWSRSTDDGGTTWTTWYEITTTEDIGVTLQAYDAGLTSIAGLTTAADTMIYTTALDTYATTSLTAAARTVLDDASVSDMRTTLGLAIGTDVEAYDAGLASIAGLTTAADKMIYTTALDTYAVTDLTSFARTILDDSDAATVLATLGARTILTSNTNYYIRTDGSDSNDGSADTSGSAWLTLQHAVDVVTSLDHGTYTVTINVGNGTYTAGAVLARHLGSGLVKFTGDTTTPSNVVISVTSDHCFTGEDCGQWSIEGFKLTTTTSGNCLYIKGGGSWVTMSGLMEYGAGAQAHLACSRNAGLVINANYTVSGSCSRHFDMSQCGNVYTIGNTVTISGSPNWSDAFAKAQLLGMITNTSTYSGGTPTGKRYDATGNSVIWVNGGGTSVFPGDTAGTTSTGAQYF